jgi:hypothetical protein
MGQIDLQKSIGTKKLNYKDSSFWRWTERGFFYSVAVIFIYFSAKDTWDGLTTDNLPISRIIFDFLIISIASWLIYSLVHMDKLTVIKGADKETNKNLMYDLLTESFTDTKFFFIDDQLFGTRQWTMKKPGKKITLIFNDSDILINITHKVRFGDMDSPFHVLTNQADIKEIKRRVEK